ncbi:cobalt-precorrin 6A reductase [Desulfitobacterium sp. LBE]|uniref:precorrin-6A reductase n=1 Tax=Desulfitobacterium sp. LBE TaxID=884086 RepID=UPI00119AFFC9|nr:precorrin-6A reductase [Desulfitobacterium sp. LBE]TWH57788.1 cobalt-precorrin 6A reductase [Desulfitobacterium sp. LBE]
MRLFVLAGTEDGRELALALQERGHEVLVSTLTEYGAELAERQGLSTCSGALDQDSLMKILQEKAMHGLIDATHPYAQNIRNLARHVAGECNLPYFRWERPSGAYLVHPLLYFASTIEESARLAAQQGKRVFLSTGSKNLRDWMESPELKNCELYVRVLPTSQVLSQCEEAGLKPYQIIAMQGPFSQRFNEGLWDQLNIDVVITKDSGTVGGTDEKVQACLQLGIPIIVLKRPQEALPGMAAEENTATIEKFMRKVEKHFEN